MTYLIKPKASVKGVIRIKGYTTFLIGEKNSDGTYHTYGCLQTEGEQFDLSEDQISRVWPGDNVTTFIAEDYILQGYYKDRKWYEVASDIEINMTGMTALDDSCVPMTRRKIHKKCEVTGVQKRSKHLVISLCGNGFIVAGRNVDTRKRFTCEECGKVHLKSDESEKEGICEDCYKTCFRKCSECGGLFAIDEGKYEDGDFYCSHCHGILSKPCYSCGIEGFKANKIFPDSCERSYCPTCYEKALERGIQNYTYKPEPEFHGEDPLQFGIELEVQVDSCLDATHVAKKVRKNSGGTHGLFYMKADSSIGENAFEMVSHPFSYKWMNENKQFLKDHIKYMADNGCKSSEDGVTVCGMHVHVSKAPWKDSQIFKLLSFVFSNRELLKDISRRDSYDLDKWASFQLDDSTPKGLRRLAKDKDDCAIERHSAMHFTDHTIEIRIFNSTLNPDTFISNIQVVRSLYDFTNEMAVRYMNPKGYLRFLQKYSSRYPELAESLKTKIDAVGKLDHVTNSIFSGLDSQQIKGALHELAKLV